MQRLQNSNHTALTPATAWGCPLFWAPSRGGMQTVHLDRAVGENPFGAQVLLDEAHRRFHQAVVLLWIGYGCPFARTVQFVSCLAVPRLVEESSRTPLPETAAQAGKESSRGNVIFWFLVRGLKHADELCDEWVCGGKN